MSFIPSYLAARALVDMRAAPPGAVLHLVHPRPIPWRNIIATVSKEVDVPLVSYEEWFAALEECASNNIADEVDAAQTNPAVRLIEFFRRGPVSLLPVSSTNAQKASETLASIPQLTGGNASEWIAAWRSTGFLAG